MFKLLFANERGEMLDHPEWGMVGRSGASYMEPLEEEMIPLPEGAGLTMVPYGKAVGIDQAGDFAPLTADPFDGSERVYPVGALLPQGFTRLLLPGYMAGDKEVPLLGYTAVGVKEGEIYVAAARTDEHHRWHPRHFNTEELSGKVAQLTGKFKDNRIVGQLGRCALQYHCFTAQNMFYGRWEAGIPVSPACNARCLGCISLQESQCCPSPQERIDFVPTAKEIAELGIFHLQQPQGEIISFGQGCEGEPSLQADTLVQAMKLIRQRTNQGTININTNGGYTDGIKKLCKGGLDSMRLSIISALEQPYRAYYQPKDYSLEQVKQSLRHAAGNGVYCSLNLLVFPGFTDTPRQLEALIDMVRSTGTAMIQLRNLNIDPDLFWAKIADDDGEPLGLLQAIELLREELPDVKVGNYSKPV